MEDFVLDDFYVPEARLLHRRGLDSNSMGIRYPFWHAACKHHHIQYAFKAPGSKPLDTDFVKLATIPERSWRHPDLKFLAEALTNYLYKFRSYLVEEVCTEVCTVHARYV